MIDMNETQKKAFTMYMDSATMDNGFTPISFLKIAEQLKEQGLSGSKSSVGRWAVKFKWKDFLEKKVGAALVEEGEAKDLIEQSVINATTQRTIDDFTMNESLKNIAYQALLAQSEKYVEKMKKGTWLTHKEENFMCKVLELTSNREDKMLDRQAVLSATKLTNSDDVLKALNDETIEVEIDE